MSDKRIALFPGSFNPFTVGHKSIVDRALPLFDHIIIAIGYNIAKGTPTDLDHRLDTLRRIWADEPRISVITYSGLTVDACRAHGARWMLRGIRTVADFEYERNLADLNRQISGIETILLFALPELGAISSSAVRELAAHGVDITPFIP